MATLMKVLGGLGAQAIKEPAVTAGAVGAGGLGLATFTGFEYNKANWMFDNAHRFARFTAIRGYMNTQVGQYRADIRGLTGHVLKKVNVCLDTACLFMCTSAALSCAGRIGMHGAAPPGWMCALYSGHIFIGIMYLTTCIWLGYHALNRASCGMVSLLTRKVRLPIPSLEQIDTARVFFSSYEKQPLRDIFRVPYFGRHPEWVPDIPANSSDEEEEKAKKSKEGKKDDVENEKVNYGAGVDCSQEGFGSTRMATVPTWIRDEQVLDKATWAVPGGEDAASLDPHDAPAHFKHYLKAQKDWFHYEVYHRILLLYGACMFLYAICYYCIATALSELRGFWIAWSIPMVFMTAQALILRLDIFKPKGQQICHHLEYIGHFAPYFAVTAGTMEFRLWYSRASVLVTWGFVLLCFFSHMLAALRFLDLAEPASTQKELPEADAKQWWPWGWKVPLAFANNLFIITPPKKLKKGQHDLLHEAVMLKASHGGVKSLRRRGKKEKGSKASRRAAVSTAKDLKGQVIYLDGRFKHIWPQVTGKDQVSLTKLYNDFEDARHQVSRMGIGGFHGDSSGSGSENQNIKDIQADPARVEEVSTALNHVAEGLDELEKHHEVDRADHPWSPVHILSMGYTADEDKSFTPIWVARSVILTHAFVWFFMILATVSEIALGKEAIVSWPGEPPWIRNQKMRPYQPGNHIHFSNDPLPDWYRLFSVGDVVEGEGPSAGTHQVHELKDPHGGAHGDAHGEAHDDGHGGSHTPASNSGSHAPAPTPDAHGHGADAHGDDSHDSHDSHGEEHGSHSSHRRLAEGAAAEAMEDLLKVLPSLDWLSTAIEKASGQPEHHAPLPIPMIPSGLPTEMAADSTAAEPHFKTMLPSEGFMGHSLKSVPVTWPTFFEPQHLACQPRATGAAIAALTSRGFGATFQLQNSSAEDQTPVVAQAFALEGVDGSLAGASWTASGLHVVTKAGVLVHCPGHKPTESGTWPCKAAAGAALAVPSGSQLLAAAVAEPKLGERLVALLFDDLPTTVVLFKDGNDSHGWQVAGEVHIPPSHARSAVRRGGQVGLAFAGDSILISSGDGSVHHRLLHTGGKQVHTAAPASSALREWRAACMPSGEGHLVRLALRQAGASASAPWRPELVLSPA